MHFGFLRKSDRRHSESAAFFSSVDILPGASLFALAAIVYGAFAGRLGFYWDDWPIVFAHTWSGNVGLREYFANDRPFSSVIYAILFPSLGVQPWRWYALSLLLRACSAWLLFLCVAGALPEHRRTAWLFSALLVLYPGFSQQAIAMTYMPQHVSLLLYAVSLVLSLLAVRDTTWRRWLLLAVALVATGLAYVGIEYFVGLELLRPVLLYLYVSRHDPQEPVSVRRRTVMWHWAPFAALLAAWSIVHTSYSVSHHYRGADSLVSSMAAHPVEALGRTVLVGLHNVIVAALSSWARPFTEEIADFRSLAVTVSWLVGALAAAIILATLQRIPETYESSASISATDSGMRARGAFLLLAIIAILVGGLPIAFAGLRSNLNDPFLDRYNLPLMVGVCLLVALLAMRLPRTAFQKSAVVFCLCLAAAAFQFRAINQYAKDWAEQRQVLWQIAWRFPALSDGTCLLVENLPRLSLIRNHAGGILTMLYGTPEHAAGNKLSAFVVDLGDRSTISDVNLRRGEPIHGALRQYSFDGNTSQCVGIWIPDHGSLRVTSAHMRDEIPGLPPTSAAVAHLSQPQWGGPGTSSDGEVPARPLRDIIGPEPQRGWAYYFQKADLARERQDWPRIIDIAEKVDASKLEPEDPSEWYPFIEAFVRTDDLRSAVLLSDKVLRQDHEAFLSLALMWNRILHSDHRASENLHATFPAFAARLAID